MTISDILQHPVLPFEIEDVKLVRLFSFFLHSAPTIESATAISMEAARLDQNWMSFITSYPKESWLVIAPNCTFGAYLIKANLDGNAVVSRRKKGFVCKRKTKDAKNWEQFEKQMVSRGYSIDRTRLSVKAANWQRPVRLSSLGYTKEVLRSRFDKNFYSNDFRQKWNTHLPYKPKKFPLEWEMDRLAFTIEHSHNTEEVLVPGCRNERPCGETVGYWRAGKNPKSDLEPQCFGGGTTVHH